MEIEKNTVKEEVAKNLLFYRKKNNFTQKELAERLGVKNNTISQWENCTNSIDVEFLFRACEIFNISIEDMYGKYAMKKNNTHSNVSPEEIALLKRVRIMNDIGRKKVVDYIEDLTLSGKYILDKQNVPISNNQSDTTNTKTFKIASRNGKSELELTEEQRKAIVDTIVNHKKTDVGDLI